MKFRSVVAVLATLCVAACGQRADEPATSTDKAPDLLVRANEIARGSIIIDGHIDVPNRIVDEWDAA